jgi:hypothetical protein
MTTTLLVDEDFLVGRRTLYHTDPHTGESMIEMQHDIEPGLAEAYERRKDRVPSAMGADGLGNHLAWVPMVVLMDLHKRGILRDQSALRHWLNQSENRPFRISTERV